MESKGVGRIYMAQEKRKWRILVNTVTNLHVL